MGDRLLTDSGRDVPIMLARQQGGEIVVARPVTAALIEAIRRLRIDVLVIDPLVSVHAVAETNEGLQAVLAEWRYVADAAGCAVELVHHTNKSAALDGDAFGVYGSRGGGALIDGVRSARFLVRMTADEAARIGIDEAARRATFRVEDGKSNMAPPGAAVWRRMIGVNLGNGAGLYPDGDWVGVCTAWTPPDAFAGMTLDDLARVQSALTTTAEPAKANERASDWAGHVVAEVLALDIGRGAGKADRNAAQNAARAKVRALLSGWLRSGALVIDHIRSPRDGRDVPVIVPGSPATEAEE